MGKLEASLELTQEVHAIQESRLPPEHKDLLRAKHSLAGALKALGDIHGARELEEYVLEVRTRTLPPEHPELDSIRSSLGGTLAMLGDLAGALALAEQVLAWRERLLPAEHPLLLSAKYSLGWARYQLGDLEGAIELFEHVHEARERLLPPDHPALIITKQGLASARLRRGDVDGAHEIYEYVLAVRKEQQLAEDHPDLLRAEGNLATTLLRRGEVARAHELNARVLAGMEQRLADEHPELLVAKQNLASTYRSLTEFDRALALDQEILNVHERVLTAGHPDLLLALSNLTLTHYLRGDLVAARETTRSLLESQRARADRLLAESPRSARSAVLVEFWRLARALLLSRVTETEGAASLDGLLFSALESLRVVSTHSAEVALAVRRFPELAGLDRQLHEVRGALSDLTASPPMDAEQVERWRAELLQRTEQRDALERTIRSSLWEKGVFTASPTLESVAAGLGEGSALLTFHRYPRLSSPAQKPHTPTPAPDHVLAFVVTPDAEVRRVELGPSAELEALAVRWRAALGQPVDRGVPAAQAPLESEVGALLRERLLDPCLAAIEGDAPNRVHVVLDDFLLLVPVDALPAEGGGRVGETLAVRPEVSVLRLIAPSRPAPRGGTLVALGGVDFDGAAPHQDTTSSDADRARPARRFAALLQSRIEVEALSLLYQDLHEGTPILLMKGEASKERLDAVALEARYLHVATHGWFAPETLRSMLEVVEPDRDDLMADIARAEQAVRGFAPETLCGLALAGANLGKDALGRVPGILTAEELAAFDLSSCELAVLSACETNVGLRRAGQGIQSLQAALHAAGARTTVTSLWRVDDAASRRLMELFYARLWKDEQGKADALWQAKMALRDEGHPPRDWAGWVLSGDPD